MRQATLRPRLLSPPPEPDGKVIDLQAAQSGRKGAGLTIDQRRILERVEIQLRYLHGLHESQEFALRLRAERRWNPKYGNGRVVETQIRRNEKRMGEVRARIAELARELEEGSSDAG